MTRQILATFCVAAACWRGTETAARAQDRPAAPLSPDAPAIVAPTPREAPAVPPAPEAAAAADGTNAPLEATSATNAPGATGGARDPFWPIGFEPARPEIAATPHAAVAKSARPPPDWDAATRKLRVTGISEKQGAFFAILKNIGLVQPGTKIQVKDEIYVYSFRVASISASGIEHIRLDAQPIQK